MADELTVIELQTGKIYYFSQSTQAFLDFFKAGAHLDDYLEHSTGAPADQEKRYLEEFCESLVGKKILETKEPHSGRAMTGFDEKVGYSRPVFLREGDANIRQLDFVSVPAPA